MRYNNGGTVRRGVQIRMVWPRAVAWRIFRAMQLFSNTFELSLCCQISRRRFGMVTGIIMHLPSMFAVLCKTCFIFLVPGPEQLAVLLNTAALRRNMFATVPYRQWKPLSVEKESDSYSMLEGTNKNWFSTCHHDFCNEGLFLSDEDEVLSSWTAMTRRGFRLFLRLPVLFLTAFFHWPSFFADFRCILCKSRRDVAWWARSLSVAYLLLAYQRCKVLRIMRSVPSTEHPCSLCSLYKQQYHRFGSHNFWKKLHGVTEFL